MNVTDYFVMLGQPRQPLLDEAALERAFHHRARAVHPDVSNKNDSGQFTELNRAFGTLRDPRSRLEHLLELENAPAGDQSVALDLAELFAKAAELANRIRSEITNTEPAASAIGNSVRQLRRSRLQEQLAPILEELQAYDAEGRAELTTLNDDWHRDRTTTLRAARRLQQRFAFLQRWITTLRELQFSLAH